MNELLESFINHLKLKKKSENTIESYKCDLTPFIEYINSLNIEAKDIKVLHLENYLATINNKESSMNRYISSLQSFFKYLHKTLEVINENPAYKLVRPKIPKRKPVFLKINEAEKLLNSVTGEYKERDCAILTIFLNCGLRLSELVDIDIDNIEGDVLMVIGKGDKQRTVYLNDSCITAINEYLKVRLNIKDEKALFLSERQQRMSKRTVQYLVKKYLNISALDVDKYSTHKLRSTSASLMAKSGTPVQVIQQILGHEKLETTMRYIGVDDDSMREAVKNNPLNKKANM